MQEQYNKKLKVLKDKNDIMNNILTQTVSDNLSLTEDLSEALSQEKEVADKLATLWKEYENMIIGNRDLHS